jgi:hypothetical protein
MLNAEVNCEGRRTEEKDELGKGEYSQLRTSLQHSAFSIARDGQVRARAVFWD